MTALLALISRHQSKLGTLMYAQCFGDTPVTDQPVTQCTEPYSTQCVLLGDSTITSTRTAMAACRADMSGHVADTYACMT